MHPIDWLIVVLLNGSIIVFALVRGRGTSSSGDWFLARRSLPWWIVGLSMYATAIDASDMVADSGGAYHFGIRLFVINWVGVVVGWFFMSQCIALSMYRAGMYTNAEYLEARFTPALRLISALIQVLHRTVVMGIMGTTVYLTLTIVCEWNATTTWTIVGVIAAVATLYTVSGGLRSVAITDALQSIIMIGASFALFFVVYNHVGGWQGITTRLDGKSHGESYRTLRVGSDRVDTKSVSDLTQQQVSALLTLGGSYERQSKTIKTETPGWLVALYFVIAGMAYSVVNHTQAMRMLGARSEWDMKMSVFVAGVAMIVVSGLNLSMGIMGKALYDLTGAEVDHVFPNIVRDYTGVGLRGIVLAGIIAASFSTYDSIGSTVSALVTRDVYSRLFVKYRDDAHYLKVGRWVTPLIILGSFLYVPFLLREGMILFYLKIVGAFVVPLLTIYVMGALTRVHRKSASVGIVVGVGYGVLFLASEPVALTTGVPILSSPFSNSYALAPISVLLTAGAMVLTSLVFGWESTELRETDPTGWLASSRTQVQSLVIPESRSAGMATLLGMTVTVVGIVLCFVVFW